ncbi:hypothetical protein SK3146_06249 [Paenibacillus konkukensis]|uniref:Anti-sigma-W factor RsiW n=2 Tax=Paenibacillus konkukensis TaxID=2020716 RepID=A0ABY4RWB9_9BACL|nr:hypothetical protein SK3146_06249 [Paenibacillus konkukensis]
MMCQEVIELMQRYLDQDLDELEYEQMLGHLKQCPDCTELFQRLVALSEELEQLPKVKPAYSLVDAIMPKLQRIDEGVPAVPFPAADSARRTEDSSAPRNPAAKETSGWRKRLRGYVSLPVVGGVVAAGLVLGFFVFQQQEQHAGMKDAGEMLMQRQSAPQSGGTASQLKRAEAPDSAAAESSATQPLAGGASGAADSASPKPDRMEVSATASNEALDPASGGGTEDKPANTPQPTGAPAADLKKAAPLDSSLPPESETKAAQDSVSGDALSDDAKKNVARGNPETEAGGTSNYSAAAEPPENPAVSARTAPAASAGNPQPAVPSESGGAGGNAGAAGQAAADSNAAAGSVKAGPPAAAGIAAGGAQSIAADSGRALAKPEAGDASKAKPEPEEKKINSLFSVNAITQEHTLSSPANTFTASVNEQHQVVVKDAQGKAVFTSRTWTDKDKVDLMEWISDNSLTYQVSNDAGTTIFVVDLKAKTETKK